MADPAVTFLLEKVTVVLKYYGDLIAGAEGELDQLKQELGFLKAFLVDAAHKSQKGEFFKKMERQIREVVYEVEDTLDTCLTQAAAAAKAKLTPSTVDMAKKVRSLRQYKVIPMFQNAKAEFAAMKFDDRSGSGGEESRAVVRKDQTIRRDKVVGFEDEEETLFKYLKEPREELDVISIIGMPGLGKTTLAWKIYESPDIQFEFRIRIWINVSQKFNRKDLLLNIMKKFTSEDISNLSDDELDEAVRACLKNEKFFIVFDDVWSIDNWDAIRNILPMSNANGKVMITSRRWEVGTRASVRRPHMLRFLTMEESWQLFQLEVFQEVNKCPKELACIGEQIVRNCDGLPLKIVVIGGILGAQFTRDRPIGMIKNEWTKVSEKVTYFLKTDNDMGITEVVALSYNRLPDDLRECLVYMGVFPEDHEIPAWTLTRLWIAEGFIQQKEGQSVEETAEEILNDLISRNLLMVATTNPIGEVKTCRVHNVIRAFCISKAAEQNLFQEIKMSTTGFLEPPVSETQRFCRLCIHFHLSEFLSTKPNGPGVRSFLSFNNDPIVLKPNLISAIPDAFGLLRVLHSKSIKFHQFPKRVTKLIHLRYITLSGDNLHVLPEAISELWNLQTLVLDTSFRVLTIRANIWKMFQLRHLKTSAAIVLAKQEEGQAGENLQTLSRLSPKHCSEDVFNRVCNLKKLGIRGRLDDLLDVKSLEKLHLLEKLKLENDLFYESTSEDPLRGLPQPNCFPPNLKRLTLSATFLDWKHMSTLAKIKTLEVLKLKDNAFTGMTWKAVGDCFSSLQFLLIEETNLVIWEASTDHFPSLTCLSLKNCEKLKQIPLELAATLQKLDIDRIRPSAVESARKIREEKEKVQGSQNSRWGYRFQLSIGIVTN